MTGMLLWKEEEKIFRDNYLFTREDLIKSFKMYIEHIEQNEHPKCSFAAQNMNIFSFEKDIYA